MRRTASGIHVPEFRLPRGAFGMPFSGGHAPSAPVGLIGGQPVGRNAYLPNELDTWCAHGNLVMAASGTSYDTLTQRGYQQLIGGSSAVTYGVTNPIAGRPTTLKLATFTTSGSSAAIQGLSGSSGGVVRRQYPGLPGNPFGYTTWAVESSLVPDLLTLVELFVGLTDTPADPVNAAAKSIGALFQASVDAVNWLTYTNTGAATTKTSTGVAASVVAIAAVRAVVTATAVQVSINGTAAAAVATTFPIGTLLLPACVVVTRTVAIRNLYVERLNDYWS